MGAGDAKWYQYILHDALIQFHHHIFPVYVGQSEFNFIGATDIRAPYYFLLGQLLDFLTWGLANSLIIQHLIVFMNAIIAAFLFYFLLTRIAPQHRWQATVVSFFYITCPGIIGLIYFQDSYHAFMAIPYVPLAIYGLILINQKNNLFSYIITALGLTLTWLAHPPIALWTTAIICFFLALQIVFLRKGFIALICVLSLLMIFNCWQFISISILNLGNECAGHGAHFLNSVFNKLSADVPAAFLPLGWANGESPDLQLGYALWLMLAISLFVAIRWPLQNSMRNLLLCVFVLFLFLFPFPYINQKLWSLTPDFVREITTAWAQQRFYVIIAAITCICAMMAFTKIQALFFRKILNVLLFGLFFWNVYQTYYFIHHGQIQKDGEISWLKSHNIFFYNYTLYPQLRDIYHEGTIDPMLKSKLLDSKQAILPEYDNEQVVISKSLNLKNTEIYSYQSFPFIINKNNQPVKKDIPLLKIKIPDNQNFLLVASINTKQLKQLSDDNYIGYSFAISSHKNTHLYFNASYRFDALPTENSKVLLPIFIDNNEENELYFTLNGINGHGKILIESYKLIKYDADSLPIHIESFTPYKAQVKTPISNTYLEIFKQYLPGYQAIVNGKAVAVFKSKNNLILIPLKNSGNNVITLYYKGTQLMHLAFILNMIIWGMLLIYLIRQRYKFII